MGIFDSIYVNVNGFQCRNGHPCGRVAVQFKCYEQHQPGLKIFAIGDRLNENCVWSGIEQGVFRCRGDKDCQAMGVCNIYIEDGYIMYLDGFEWDIRYNGRRKRIPVVTAEQEGTNDE